ncbi:AMP-binding enzyme [Massilia agri]|uniref:AMP-binding protein n=1 Tax=Massilia agri TaxID=1886785 RepID=A0ABT2APQ8_9BURK|nr:AMP-binding protein [Massilia agri]MCS0598238.1 AMP-binding protein [Massilia agri]
MTVLTASRGWWEHRPTLERVVSDLLAGELALMRPGQPRRALPWPPGFDLAADLGADSLELLGMATAMEQVLAIGCIGEDRVLANPRLEAWVDAVAAGLAQSPGGGGRMVFRTSGSSGAPKDCPHALAELEREAEVLAGLFAGTRRIVSLVASHHIYGFLFTVLLPRALGLAPSSVRDLRGASPGAVARQLEPGDLVVGFPDFWRTFAPVAGSLPQGITGVSSTAPCPDEVARAVQAAGVRRLVQVYGSSETAGVGWREGPDEDYRLFPYWRRGEANPEGVQTLTRQTENDGTRQVALQDKLEWQGPARLRPAGRVDQAVQVGGINVFPAYVADVLRMHPQVAQASVRLMRPDEGRRLKAFVVPREGAPPDPDALRTELTAWMAERLPAPERPSAYSFGAALPRQASGKPTDWIIDAWD